ncbi:hypothetical protein ABKV19_008613 [Rosa sericea]
MRFTLILLSLLARRDVTNEAIQVVTCKLQGSQPTFSELIIPLEIFYEDRRLKGLEISSGAETDAETQLPVKCACLYPVGLISSSSERIASTLLWSKWQVRSLNF